MSFTDSESDALLDTGQKISRKSLCTKWYVLAVYSLTSFWQVIIWNTFSPIANSVLYAYMWHERTIAMINNWAGISCLIFVYPCCWLLKEKGLRFSCILASFLSTVGSAIRILAHYHQTIFVHIGAIFNGIGGVILSAAIMQLSSIWFPATQRTSSTGIGTSFALLGIAGSYLLCPFMVEEPMEQTDAERYRIKEQIFNLLLTTFAVQSFLFAIIFSTFPDRPKVPPSMTSFAKIEVSFWKSIRQTFRNVEFWKISLSNGLCSGISGPWLSTMTLNFAHRGITQTETARLGFWAVVCGFLLGLSVSKVSDFNPGNLKMILVSLISFCVAMFFWIVAMTTEIVPYSEETFSIAVIAGLSILWSTTAIFYEMAAELNYPIREEIVAGCTMAVTNVISTLVYLSIYIFPNINWINYGLLIFGTVSLILLIYVKPDYKRLNIDLK